MDGIYDEYVEALKNEIFLYSSVLKDYECISIFFGGGTPTILESWQLLEILEACRGLFNLTTDLEVSYGEIRRKFIWKKYSCICC
ncbi:MAG: hypothetical protein HY279_10045 [Nitrospinae bacterium]|nr:hypothetical protein [Nitrospinota bacterium]